MKELNKFIFLLLQNFTNKIKATVRFEFNFALQNGITGYYGLNGSTI